MPRNPWSVRTEDIRGGERFEILRDGSNVSFSDVFGLLETDPEFASWYTDLLRSSEFESFFWEHPPLSTTTHGSAAEFVLLDGPSLARLHPDPEAFRHQFERKPDEGVVTFPNLGGDAVLVAPRPVGPPAAYAHLAAFVRQAPVTQVQCLCRHVGRAVRENLGAEPRWLSTAGMGVSWLHVRLDSRPKYYRFGPYKAEPARSA